GAAGFAVAEGRPALTVLVDVADLACVVRIERAIDVVLAIDVARARCAIADVVATLAGRAALSLAALAAVAEAAVGAIGRVRPLVAGGGGSADLEGVEGVEGAVVPVGQADVAAARFAAVVAALARVATETAAANLRFVEIAAADEVVGRFGPVLRIAVRVAE